MRPLSHDLETKEDIIMSRIQTVIFNWEWGSDSKRCLNHIKRLIHPKGYKRPVELIKKIKPKGLNNRYILKQVNKKFDRIDNNLNKLRKLR